MILQMAERKKAGKLKQLIVMGCLSERYRAELEEELPEVDAYYGKFDFMQLVELLNKDRFAEGQKTKDKNELVGCQTYERKLTTPKHYAYLKISEGCNRMCSYCAIPLITGRHTSRPMEEILDEVRWLVGQGVKEFNVIAQDLSSYGLDLKPTPSNVLRTATGSPIEQSSSPVKGREEKRHLLPELIDQMVEIGRVRRIRLPYA